MLPLAACRAQHHTIAIAPDGGTDQSLRTVTVLVPTTPGGDLLVTLNEPDKALEVYRAALKLNPHLKDLQDAVERLDAQLGGQEL